MTTNPYKNMYVLCEDEYKRFIALDRLVEKQAHETPPRSDSYHDNMQHTSESLERCSKKQREGNNE